MMRSSMRRAENLTPTVYALARCDAFHAGMIPRPAEFSVVRVCVHVFVFLFRCSAMGECCESCGLIWSFVGGSAHKSLVSRPMVRVMVASLVSVALALVGASRTLDKCYDCNHFHGI